MGKFGLVLGARSWIFIVHTLPLITLPALKARTTQHSNSPKAKQSCFFLFHDKSLVEKCRASCQKHILGPKEDRGPK